MRRCWAGKLVTSEVCRFGLQIVVLQHGVLQSHSPFTVLERKAGLLLSGLKHAHAAALHAALQETFPLLRDFLGC